MAADCLQARPSESDALTQAQGRVGSPVDGKVQDPAITVRCTVLTGAGGVGKTQFAAAIYRAWCAGPGEQGLAVWTNATTRDAIVTTFASAAESVAEAHDPLVPKDPALAAEWFLNWLESTSRPWLVVLDDLADPADMRRLWPSGAAGTSVVTTRRADTVLRQNGRTLIEVKLFSKDQARNYLNIKLDEASTAPLHLVDQVDELAKDLSYLPLALAQAANFILDHNETCATYRRRFAQRRLQLAELLPTESLGDDYGRTVAATVAISLGAADGMNPIGAARPVLEIAALLDQNGFPLDILSTDSVQDYIFSRQEGPIPAGQYARDNSIGSDAQAGRDGFYNLLRLSLVTYDPQGESRAVRVHSLVQRVMRERNADLRQATQAAASAILEAWSEDPHNPAVAQAYRDNVASLEHFADSALWQPDVFPTLFRCGNSIGESGQVVEATHYWYTIALAAHEWLGPEHPYTFGARGNLAEWRGEAGDLVGAERDYEALARDSSRSLGPDHPYTLISRANHAQVREQAGDLSGAIESTEAVLPDMLRIFGPTDRDTLALRARLASWQGKAGDAHGAILAFERLLDDLGTALGADHPSTLDARSGLAHWRGETGDADGAATAYDELVDDFHGS